LINSWYAENPESLGIWVSSVKDSMDAYAQPLGQFTTAWNGWYALGHTAVWNAILYDPARLRALALADTIAQEDGDPDGGVPARPSDADTMDQTWGTTYLAHHALDPWIRATSVPPSAGNDGTGPSGGARGAIAIGAAPNPFATETSLRFALPREGRAR